MTDSRGMRWSNYSWSPIVGRSAPSQLLSQAICGTSSGQRSEVLLPGGLVVGLPNARINPPKRPTPALGREVTKDWRCYKPSRSTRFSTAAEIVSNRCQPKSGYGDVSY